MRVIRRLPFIRTLLALSAGLILATTIVFGLLRLDRVSVAPGLLAGGSAPLYAPRDGLIEKAFVRSGETVKTGQPLLQIDTRDLTVESARRQASIEALETRRGAAIAESRHLEGAVHPKEREESARQAERSRIRQTQAELSAQAITRLGQEGIAGQLQVEQSELERKLAAVSVAEADEAGKLLRERQRARQDGLEAEIRRLEEEIEAERVVREAVVKAIEDSLLRAPAAGVVATSRVDEISGRAVRAGDEILRLAVSAPTRFEGMLSDLARPPVRLHQRVRIRLEGYPWLLYGTLQGEVVRVSDRRESAAGFPVEVELDPATAPGPLADGMRATARIVIDEKVSLLRLLFENVMGRSGA
jgi:multidrug resistance efflux pump